MDERARQNLAHTHYPPTNRANILLPLSLVIFACTAANLRRSLHLCLKVAGSNPGPAWMFGQRFRLAKISFLVSDSVLMRERRQIKLTSYLVHAGTPPSHSILGPLDLRPNRFN